MDDFRALLADDAYAASFQTLSQYRTALLKAMPSNSLPVAEPQQGAPSDDDLRGIFYRHCDSSDDGPSWIEEEQFIAAARALLARYGAHPAPVPVAERLPGEGDLKDGQCWLLKQRAEPSHDLLSASWVLGKSYTPAAANFFKITHWLPHWALPLPQEGQS